MDFIFGMLTTFGLIAVISGFFGSDLKKIAVYNSQQKKGNTLIIKEFMEIKMCSFRKCPTIRDYS
jgi:hypothetical protein